MPGISRAVFESGGMTADYNALQREISSMRTVFRRKRSVRVKTQTGTDVEFLTGGRWVLEDNGICNRPQQVSNLPAGKVFVLPKEGTMSGKIVIDGSWQGDLLSDPVSFQVENGKTAIARWVDGDRDRRMPSVPRTKVASSRLFKLWLL